MKHTKIIKGVNEIYEVNDIALLNNFKSENHNAFTSVVYNKFLNKYFCVFRSAKTHTSTDGKIYITSSKDGVSWVEPTIIINTDNDDRDPSLFVDDDGTMYINFFTLVDSVGSIYVSSSKDGINWSNPNLVISSQFVTSPILKYNNKYYMSTYGVGTISIYTSNNPLSTFSKVTDINISPDLSPTEPMIMKLSDNRFVCLIRLENEQDSYIYKSESTNLTNWTNAVQTSLKGKPRGYIVYNNFILLGIRKVNKYVYYGECFVYKLDIDTLDLLSKYNISNSYDGDVGYFSFASKDNKELIISYYDKQVNSASTARVLKTKFSKFIADNKLIGEKHSLSSHEYPYVLVTEDTQNATLTLIHEKNGDYFKLVDDRGKVCLVLRGLTNPTTEKSQHVKISNPEGGALYIQSADSNGIVYMGINNEFELNSLGKLISRKGQDLRGGTSSEQIKILRKNLDTSSGYVDVQRLDVGLTSNRPTGIQVGYCYWDSSLQKPIWWNGTVWKDATGTTV